MTPDPRSNGDSTPAGDPGEAGDITEAGAIVDAHGVAIGTDARAQSVIVTVQQAVKQDMPDQMSNYTLHQMVLGIIQAIQDLEIRLWKNAKADQADRALRQEEADRHRISVRHWLLLLGIGMALALLLMIYLIGR